MKAEHIAIIGGGNLGASIAEGLVHTQFVPPEAITVTRRKTNLILHLGELGINISSNNTSAVSEADIVIVAVQPKQMHDVLLEIRPVLDPEKHILISTAAGFSIRDIQDVVGTKVAVMRAMPNTAIAIQQSMTCIATQNSSEEQKEKVTSLFDKLGKTAFIEEELMESATVLGACGIAFAMRFIRATTQGGIEIGFEADLAQLIATQTVKGASSLLLEKSRHPEQEIDKVTTPRGCTIAGINEMEHQGFSSALIKGVITSYGKIAKLQD